MPITFPTDSYVRRHRRRAAIRLVCMAFLALFLLKYCTGCAYFKRGGGGWEQLGSDLNSWANNETTKAALRQLPFGETVAAGVSLVTLLFGWGVTERIRRSRANADVERLAASIEAMKQLLPGERADDYKPILRLIQGNKTTKRVDKARRRLAQQ